MKSLVALAVWGWVVPATAASVNRGVPVANDEARPDYRVEFSDTLTPHYVPLSSQVIPGSHEMHLRRRANVEVVDNAGIVKNVSAALTNFRDMFWMTDLLLGNHSVTVQVDTGTSDTWVIHEPYQCDLPEPYYWGTDPNPPPPPKPDCGLHGGLTGEPTGGVINNVTFVRQYQDGSYVLGYFGLEDVGIGGLTAKNQRIAIVNRTQWYGDGKTAGLLGLGYPYLTSLDQSEETKPLYDPVFTTLWKDKIISPLFSIALSRYVDPTTAAPQKSSFLALGGLPPVSYDESSWARAPLQDMSTLTNAGLTSKEHGFYIITPDAWVYGFPNGTNSTVPASVPAAAPSAASSAAPAAAPALGSNISTVGGLTRNATKFPVLLDVGASLSYLPESLVRKLYDSFDPPAKYNSEDGLYVAKCDGKAPKFGIELGGKTIFLAPEDLLRQRVRDSTGVYCRIGITDQSDNEIQILGASFFSSVVAVFDVEKQEARFAARTHY